LLCEDCGKYVLVFRYVYILVWRYYRRHCPTYC